MNDTLFIAGGSPATNKIIEHYLSKGRKIVSAAFGEENANEETSDDGLMVTYPWIPGSSLSPRNILIQSSREQGAPGQAFLVYNSGIAGGAFHQMSSAAIQRLLDQKVKSYLFFLKELISHFVEQKGGTLSVILQSEPGVLRDPVSAGAYGMLKALVTASQQAYEQEMFQLSLYETDSADITGFVNYIIENQDESRNQGNQIYPYPPKSSFFSISGKRRN